MPTVIRPTSQLSAEQQALLKKAKAAARHADDAEARAWDAIKAARDGGVPDTLLCDETQRSRATLNRKFGPRQSPELS